MNRIALLTLALAAAATSSVALAQTATQPRVPAAHRADAGQHAHQGGHGRMHGRMQARGHHAGIARLDANQDGRISREELSGQRFGGRLAEHFAEMDANHDGYLVRTELGAWQARMQPQRQAHRAQRFDARFKDADLNRDGKLSRIEASEKLPHLQKGFAWMDDNRDGFLSREELHPRRR
jgi:Ca2+-binding EF-hand superfamily protein